MAFLHQFNRERIPRTRVELHLHLDGSVRPETIWELAKKKGIVLPGSCLSDFKKKLLITSTETLSAFLSHFKYFIPTLLDDLEAAKRIAYELCKDQADEGVLYFETRYAPQLLLTGNAPITAGQVVEAVNSGLKRGEKDFNVKARSILCCCLNNDDWARATLNLCQQYRSQGVVGIDIAKDEAERPLYTKTEIEVYQRAKQLGINRTAHAGESGNWESVREAMDSLDCSRVGHGYRVFMDPSGETYRQAKRNDLHFEVCPYSSVLTGGCPLSLPKHSVVKFAEDDVNFSISKDDPTITGSTLDDEYRFLMDLGLTEAHIIQANFNAARSCFLDHQEKYDLIGKLRETLKIPSY